MIYYYLNIYIHLLRCNRKLSWNLQVDIILRASLSGMMRDLVVLTIAKLLLYYDLYVYKKITQKIRL